MKFISLTIVFVAVLFAQSFARDLPQLPNEILIKPWARTTPVSGISNSVISEVGWTAHQHDPNGQVYTARVKGKEDDDGNETFTVTLNGVKYSVPHYRLRQ
ncbi:hypothetical protein Ddc_19017 [Ditylenchus destructor]|nr:hypothetical protein Ddc_19017 [Ditylenchus destructor]